MEANPQKQTTTEPDLKKFSTRLPKALIRRLNLYCVKADTSAQAVSIAAIEMFLDKYESTVNGGKQIHAARSTEKALEAFLTKNPKQK